MTWKNYLDEFLSKDSPAIDQKYAGAENAVSYGLPFTPARSDYEQAGGGGESQPAPFTSQQGTSYGNASGEEGAPEEPERPERPMRRPPRTLRGEDYDAAASRSGFGDRFRFAGAEDFRRQIREAIS